MCTLNLGCSSEQIALYLHLDIRNKELSQPVSADGIHDWCIDIYILPGCTPNSHFIPLTLWLIQAYFISVFKYMGALVR